MQLQGRKQDGNTGFVFPRTLQVHKRWVFKPSLLDPPITSVNMFLAKSQFLFTSTPRQCVLGPGGLQPRRPLRSDQ